MNDNLFEELQTFLNKTGHMFVNRGEAVAAFFRQQDQQARLQPDRVEALDWVYDETDEMVSMARVKELERLVRKQAKQKENLTLEQLYIKGALGSIYLMLYLDQPAKKIFEEIYQQDKNNQVNTIYSLMIVYCRLGEVELAEELMRAVSNSMDISLLFLMLLTYLRNVQYDKARQTIKILWEVAPEIEDIFTDNSRENIEEIEELSDKHTALYDILFTVEHVMSEYVFEWIYTEIYKLKKSLKHPQLKSKKTTTDKDIFAGIDMGKQEIFRNHHLTTNTAFARKTRAEVLAIKGIGKMTVDLLEKNGVIFKGK